MSPGHSAGLTGSSVSIEVRSESDVEGASALFNVHKTDEISRCVHLRYPANLGDLQLGDRYRLYHLIRNNLHFYASIFQGHQSGRNNGSEIVKMIRALGDETIDGLATPSLEMIVLWHLVQERLMWTFRYDMRTTR